MSFSARILIYSPCFFIRSSRNCSSAFFFPHYYRVVDVYPSPPLETPTRHRDLLLFLHVFSLRLCLAPTHQVWQNYETLLTVHLCAVGYSLFACALEVLTPSASTLLLPRRVAGDLCFTVSGTLFPLHSSRAGDLTLLFPR